MDSVSHTRVGNLLLDYVQETEGVEFDRKAFLYGNLKPDLTGTYLTKRHYPSLMFDEVMGKIQSFADRYEINAANPAVLSVDLGEICHYITDFFCFPHNDDIYAHNLLHHYVYEKRIALGLRRQLTEKKFLEWVDAAPQISSVNDLIAYIKREHEQYRTAASHNIPNDLEYICRICVGLVTALVHACKTGLPVHTAA